MEKLEHQVKRGEEKSSTPLNKECSETCFLVQKFWQHIIRSTAILCSIKHLGRNPKIKGYKFKKLLGVRKEGNQLEAKEKFSQGKI